MPADAKYLLGMSYPSSAPTALLLLLGNRAEACQEQLLHPKVRSMHLPFAIESKEKKRLHLLATILMRSQVLYQAARILLQYCACLARDIPRQLCLYWCCYASTQKLVRSGCNIRQDQCTSNRFIVPDWVAGMADQLFFAAAFVQQAKGLPQTAAKSQGRHIVIALPAVLGWVADAAD